MIEEGPSAEDQAATTAAPSCGQRGIRIDAEIGIGIDIDPDFDGSGAVTGSRDWAQAF